MDQGPVDRQNNFTDQCTLRQLPAGHSQVSAWFFGFVGILAERIPIHLPIDDINGELAFARS